MEWRKRREPVCPPGSVAPGEAGTHQALVCPTSHGFFSPHLGVLGWMERLPQGPSLVS